MSDDELREDTTTEPDANAGRDWETELAIAHGRIDDLEREVQQKEFQLDLNGAMARLNVAGQILGGMYAGHYAQPESVVIDADGCCAEAMEIADTLVGAYEQKMEARSAQFMQDRAMRPSDHVEPETLTEN